VASHRAESVPAGAVAEEGQEGERQGVAASGGAGDAGWACGGEGEGGGGSGGRRGGEGDG